MALSTEYIKGLIEACIEACWNIGAYLVSRHQLGNLPYNSSKIHDYNMSTIEHQPPPPPKKKKKKHQAKLGDFFILAYFTCIVIYFNGLCDKVY